jgi:hypothetical protein
MSYQVYLHDIQTSLQPAETEESCFHRFKESNNTLSPITQQRQQQKECPTSLTSDQETSSYACQSTH